MIRVPLFIVSLLTDKQGGDQGQRRKEGYKVAGCAPRAGRETVIFGRADLFVEKTEDLQKEVEDE